MLDWSAGMPHTIQLLQSILDEREKRLDEHQLVFEALLEVARLPDSRVKRVMGIISLVTKRSFKGERRSERELSRVNKWMDMLWALQSWSKDYSAFIDREWLPIILFRVSRMSDQEIDRRAVWAREYFNSLYREELAGYAKDTARRASQLKIKPVPSDIGGPRKSGRRNRPWSDERS